MIRTSGILLPKTHSRYLDIESSLNRYIESWSGNSQQITFYQDLGDSILIPRYYPLDENIRDDIPEGEIINIESKIIPRNDRQRAAIQYLSDNRCGILRLETGTGKTICAIASICNIKRKTIIIAHKDKLLDMWKDSIVEHTSLTEDEVGRLYSNNYKEVFDKPIILATPHIFAAAVNKNNTDFLKSLHSANIGVMFVDEVHANIGPEMFSKASLCIAAYRTFGLSATPTRGDGCSDIINYHLGEVNYIPPEEGEMLDPIIYMMHMPFGIYKKNKYFHWNGEFQLARYYSQMEKAVGYHRTLSKWINKMYKEGRKILVLGNNIKPLLTLAKETKLPKNSVGIFTPGANQKQFKKLLDEVTDKFDLDEAFYKRSVVFATLGACKEGMSRKDLDVLVMQCPTANMEQAVGRVLRSLDGKKQPIVIDMVDTEGPAVTSVDNGKREQVNWFIRSSRKRLAMYEKKKWKVKVFKIKVDPLEENNVEEED